MYIRSNKKIQKQSVNRVKLAARVSKKIGLALPTDQISDSIVIIEEFILNKIKNNESVTINNFGTFSPTGNWPNRSLKFIINEQFRSIIKKVKKNYE